MSEFVKKRDRTRISSKHQITIPADSFGAAGLHPGDTLVVKATGPGTVVLSKLEADLDAYDGRLATGGQLRETVERLRGEWD